MNILLIILFIALGMFLNSNNLKMNIVKIAHRYDFISTSELKSTLKKSIIEVEIIINRMIEDKNRREKL